MAKPAQKLLVVEGTKEKARACPPPLSLDLVHSPIRPKDEVSDLEGTRVVRFDQPLNHRSMGPISNLSSLDTGLPS